MNRAGWFGKIPSLGDFVTRRLPGSFVEPWDEWLSEQLSQARLLLGESWQATYADASIACFLLGAHTVDEHAWHGILVPSFDRVGREFPLTIAVCHRAAAAGAFQGCTFAALVAAGRRALEVDCGADGVDQALAVVALGDGAKSLQPAEFDALHVGPVQASLSDGTSAWWSWSQQEPPAAAAPSLCQGLPCGAAFRKLLGAAEAGCPHAPRAVGR